MSAGTHVVQGLPQLPQGVPQVVGQQAVASGNLIMQADGSVVQVPQPQYAAVQNPDGSFSAMAMTQPMMQTLGTPTTVQPQATSLKGTFYKKPHAEATPPSVPAGTAVQ